MRIPTEEYSGNTHNGTLVTNSVLRKGKPATAFLYYCWECDWHVEGAVLDSYLRIVGLDLDLMVERMMAKEPCIGG